MSFPTSRDACLATAILSLTAAGPLQATEWLVEDVIDLAGAFQLAQDGDTISIMPGDYMMTQTLAVSDIALTIRGEGAGPSQVTLNGQNLIRLLEISGAGANGTTVENMTFVDGHSIENVAAATGGGAIHAEDCAVTISGCVFDGNQATNPLSDARGGAIWGEAGDFTILDSAFRNNTAHDGGADGGAIFLTGTTTHLIADCLFEDNTAQNTGGAVRIDQGVAQLTRCDFIDNELVDTGDRFGGGFFTRSTSVITIDHCTFVGNVADVGGGIGSLDATVDLLVRNSTFQLNSAATVGGAIESSGTIAVVNATFEGNSAPTESVIRRRGGTVDVANSILWNNVPANAALPGANTTVAYSIVQNGFAGTGILDADPLFADAANGDLRPTVGSPAIDAGSTGRYAGPFIDLANNPRATDDLDAPDTGESVAGPVIDMGAFEVVVNTGGPDTCPADVDDDGQIGFGDIIEVLSNWGVCP